jgi:lytic murein transglycosylase
MKNFLVLVMMVAVLGAGECKNSGDFGVWLSAFKQEAISEGISQDIVDRLLDGVMLDPEIIKKDRRQSVFSQTFIKFSDRMVSNYRLAHGKKRIKKYHKTFQKIEERFGIPASVIVAFWGLETDFGAFMGKSNTISSLATLAYDCRRGELFRPQLKDALRIAQRGDIKTEDMRGAWAGELGHMQFLPSDYIESGVDFNGDGKVDLVHSVEDALASGANLMKSFGWKRGEPWLVEVRIAHDLPWEETGIDIAHPVSYWHDLGVKRVDGKTFADQAIEASLLLPMGKDGVAFLVFDNFKNVYLTWNESLIYSTTAAYFATRLSGAKKANPGKEDIDSLSFAQIKELQHLLVKLGYDVGKVDGIIGKKTRQSVKAMQKKLDMPQDSYPTVTLLKRLKTLQ